MIYTHFWAKQRRSSAWSMQVGKTEILCSIWMALNHGIDYRLLYVLSFESLVTPWADLLLWRDKPVALSIIRTNSMFWLWSKETRGLPISHVFKSTWEPNYVSSSSSSLKINVSLSNWVIRGSYWRASSRNWYYEFVN